MTASANIDWTWSPKGACGHTLFDVDVRLACRVELCDGEPLLLVDRITIGDGAEADEPSGELKTAMHQDLEADEALLAELCTREGIIWTGANGNDPDGKWRKAS
jgi:hypothetical protein